MAFNFLIKPSLETKFAIDYDWWVQSRDDLQVYLLTHLTPEQQSKLAQGSLQEVFDYVDPQTGEVFPRDRLSLALAESARHDELFPGHIGLIDSVFRALLINSNRPLNARELADITGRDAATILKTIGGLRIYRGISPVHSD
ncbi:MAG: hypothetical protein OXE95_12125 [Chloroflexi bacterium]|nr:hypothetical protein [Chloroflexota bacterium]MCY4248308.1 hypothetical protein [Chloroflexota bacterium]